MTMLKRLKKRQNFDNIEENSGYSRLQSKNMTMIVLDEEMIYCDNIEDIDTGTNHIITVSSYAFFYNLKCVLTSKLIF